jgi:hypothetical protein
MSNYCPDFFDDFSNPASGWEVGEDAYVAFGYINGEYRIRAKKAGYFYLFESPSCQRENYEVEVDVRWEGSTGSGHGILFGIAGDFQRYFLYDINTDYRMYRLLLRDNNTGEWEVLVSPTASGAIRGGNATNRLKVITDGTGITLLANGTTLRFINDHRVTGLTGAGIVSLSYNNRPASDARFDNFSMVQLAGNGGKVLGSFDVVDSDGPGLVRSGIVPLDSVPDWDS